MTDPELIISWVNYAEARNIPESLRGALYSMAHPALGFIHSQYFYSISSSPLLLRGALDYSTDTVNTPKFYK